MSDAQSVLVMHRKDTCMQLDLVLLALQEAVL